MTKPHRNSVADIYNAISVRSEPDASILLRSYFSEYRHTACLFTLCLVPAGHISYLDRPHTAPAIPHGIALTHKQAGAKPESQQPGLVIDDNLLDDAVFTILIVPGLEVLTKDP